MSAPPTPGTLTLVATPIGNLGDWPRRATDALARAGCLACEDTRVAGALLAKLELPRPERLLSYREENEREVAAELAALLESGVHVVLMADAGTPAISDPGFRLVRECRRRDLPVTAVPGPCAAVTALALSGLPSDGFLYAGFLPPKRAARKRFFERYREFEYTLVLYESCHRIGKCLADIVEVLGPDRCLSVARELTKRHETVHTGPAAKVADAVATRSKKGEFVIVIAKQGFAL